VIYPWKLHEWLRDRNEITVQSEASEGVCVHRPLMISVSNRRLGAFNTFALTQASFQHAVWRALNQLREKPDAVYGHFLYSAGAAAAWAGARLGCPSFVAVGESTGPGSEGIWSLQHVKPDAAKERFARAAGFMAVSEGLRQQLLAELSIPEAKIKVFPNGIDPVRFHRRNRQAMRRKHALPPDDFLVIFVGAFDERKGSLRVHQALTGLPAVQGIFVGEGPLRPSGKQVAFCGRAFHEEVAELLCAADLFVLPSREEGCSNATLEAMACGLPVVVSRRPFNAGICDQKNAWLVEPDDISEIRQAIVQLKDNAEHRRRLGDAAFARCTRFDIRDRARNVLAWMEERIAADKSSVPDSAELARQTRRMINANESN